MRYRSTALAALPVLALLAVLSQALAHRSGCHRWHSCPSDTGSYGCGDTGHSNFCGNTTVTPSQTNSSPLPSYGPAKPKFAAKHTAYIAAGDLREVGGHTSIPFKGWYQLDVNGKQMRVQANSKSAWLGKAKYSLKAAPYLSEGKLYVPATALGAMGCTLDTAYLPSFVSVDCGYEHGLLDATLW